jgi:hypothetical protein
MAEGLRYTYGPKIAPHPKQKKFACLFWGFFFPLAGNGAAEGQGVKEGGGLVR